MDVSVRYKSRQERVQRSGEPGLFANLKTSLLGDGLLERARATSLALLGATAAVGLAIVALALNQEWPLIAGSSIPAAPHAAVGDAAAVAHANAKTSGRLSVGARTPTGHSPHVGARTPSRHLSAGAVSDPEAGSEIVVSASEPVNAPKRTASKPPPSQGPETAPQPPAPQQAPATPPATPPQPEPAVTSTPPSSTPSTAPPTVTTAETPSGESSVPPWSHGNGHAYGRGEGWGGDESSDEDSDGHGGWEGGHGGWSGGHGHGGHDG